MSFVVGPLLPFVLCSQTHTQTPPRIDAFLFYGEWSQREYPVIDVIGLLERQWMSIL